MAADRIAAHVARLDRLPALRSRLRECADVGELFSRGAELARLECGFDRAVVLSIERSRLTADASDVLTDAASDTLRRRVLDSPVALRGTPEDAVPVLIEQLELTDCAVGEIAPEGRPLALLVVDRGGPVVEDIERTVVRLFAGMLAIALEHTVLNTRLHQLSAEVRNLSVSAQALMTEVIHAPVALPVKHGGRPAFPLFEGVEPMSPAGLRDGLSERESTIAALLAEGMSNKEIADHLVLSPETVKSHVARVLSKLDASNRVEAATRYLRLTRQL